MNNNFGGKITDSPMSLIAILKRCRELSDGSQDSIWASRGVSEVVAVLDRGIASPESGSKVNRAELTLLFAPTGDLQETSMAKGWTEEYLLLSAKFDALIDEAS